MPIDTEAVGRRLKRLREAFPDLPDKAGIGRTTWANYEAGIRRLGIGDANHIKEQTGATLDWLFNGEETGMPMHLLRRVKE